MPRIERDEVNNKIVKEKILEITNDHISILAVEKAMELNLHDGPKNGKGDRSKLHDMYILTVIYGNKRSPMTYPKCYEEHIELNEENMEMIEEYKKKRIEEGLECGQGVIGFIIHGDNEDKKIIRSIRQDIKEFHSHFPCVKCGNKKTICDHKNDLYNDPRVLDINTQTKDDFQSLCNGCNLRKRAVSLKRDKEKKRQPPTPDILSINGGIEFTKGDETYNPQDVNALVGTYWYDPIQFGKECRQINSSKQIIHYQSLN